MKKATVQKVSVHATCPACGGTLTDPESGSLYINVNQYAPTQKFACEDCGNSFLLERKAWA